MSSITLRKRKRKNGEFFLWLDIYHDQKRMCEWLNLKLTGGSQDKEILEMAKTIRAKRELELQAGTYELPSFKKKVNYFEYAEPFIQRLSPNTIATFRNTFIHLKTFKGDDQLTFDKITPKFCQQFIQYMQDNGIRPNSVGTYFSKFKTIINHAINDGILNQKPFKNIKLKGEETLPKFLTIEELKLMLDNPCQNKEVVSAFFFSCLTGLRWSDISILTWDKINLEKGFILIEEVKTKSKHIEPLSKQALFILMQRHNNQGGNDLVFQLPHRNLVNKELGRWAMRTIGKGVSFHSARHTFATLLLTSGVDLYTTSKLLGHKGIGTTTIYAKVIDKKKIEAVNQLEVHTNFLLVS